MKETIYGLIEDNRQIKFLKDICQEGGIQTGPFGSLLHKKDYQSTGTPIITVEHLGENRILHIDMPRVSDKDKKRLSRFVICNGDIIFSRVGSVDRRSLVREMEDGWLFSGRCLRVRPDQSQVDSRYLSWFFGLEAFKEYIRKIAFGVTMPSLNTKILSNIPIILPPLPEQRAIAEVLSSLDDKIELNRRMNRTLEQLAQAIYKHMFIENPEREGWQIRPLSIYADFIKGVSYSSSELVAKSNSALVSLKSINRGGGYKVDGLKAYEGIYKPQQIISPGEVVVAHTDLTQAADVIGRAAIVEENESYSTLIASLDLVIVRPKKDGVSNEYLYCLLSFGDFPDFAYGYTNGTTVLHLSSKALEDYSFPAPPQSKISEFSEIVTPIFKQIELNNKQSRTLEKLRDTLLPKLMSGQVRVTGGLSGN